VNPIPRVKLELESLKDCAYDLRYYPKMQGFAYSLLEGTPYEPLHDKNGYKNFCPSNIDPPFDMKEGDRRYLAISSPDPGLISTFATSLEKIETANIGDMSFSIERIKILRPRIGRTVTLVTRTPIICRIPKENYKKYGINPGDYPYVYWRKDLPFNVFLRQLEDNLIKKYQQFHSIKVDESRYLPLFQQFLFKKQVCNHLVFNDEDSRVKEFKVFGSLWEFTFHHLTKEQRNLLQFGLDAGFGERNPLGFGFMDIKRRREAG